MERAGRPGSTVAGARAGRTDHTDHTGPEAPMSDPANRAASDAAFAREAAERAIADEANEEDRMTRTRGRRGRTQDPDELHSVRHGGPTDEEELLSLSPFGGDLEKDLAAEAPRRLRGLGPTAYLCGAILLVAGFIGGAQAQRLWGGDSGQAASAAGFPAAGPGGQGLQGLPGSQGSQASNGAQSGTRQRGSAGQGAAGGTAGAADMTLGTVQKVDGNVIYLKTMTGETVKITTNRSTKVQVTADGAVSDLKSGTTVVVRGSTGSGGVAATSISQSGGLPGGGFGPPS